MSQENNSKIIFFGSSLFSIYVLEELKKAGMVPAHIVTLPAKPKGRGLALSETEVAEWAKKHSVPTLTPSTLRDETALVALTDLHADLFVVASYGKIIPAEILALPRHGALNVHPSLLPKFRGPSPLQSAILADSKETGVTIILMDAEVDHGPIVAQEKVEIPNWPATVANLEKILGEQGGQILASIIPVWLKEEIKEVPQNHTAATFTKMLEKKDGEIDLGGDPYKNFLIIQAMGAWPGAYFFAERHGKKIRVLIKHASFRDGQLIIEKVVPEGKKEMSYGDFLKGISSSPIV